MKIVLSSLLMVVLFITTGCSPKLSKYSVMLDAITAPNISIRPSTFMIKPLDNNINAESLTFQKKSHILFSILKEKGYTPVEQITHAEQIIYLGYGIDKVKEERETYTEPSMSMSVGFASPFYHPFYGGFHHHHYHPMFYNSLGYTSYRTYSKTYSYYNRYVTLLAKSAQGKELWRVDVSSVGESQNMKKIIPLLIKATAPYLGTNTAEPIQLVIKENEKKEH